MTVRIQPRWKVTLRVITVKNVRSVDNDLRDSEMDVTLDIRKKHHIDDKRVASF
jgi:hypothetical protein